MLRALAFWKFASEGFDFKKWQGDYDSILETYPGMNWSKKDNIRKKKKKDEKILLAFENQTLHFEKFI